MTDADLAATIDAAWENREALTPATGGAYLATLWCVSPLTPLYGNVKREFDAVCH